MADQLTAEEVQALRELLQNNSPEEQQRQQGEITAAIEKANIERRKAEEEAEAEQKRRLEEIEAEIEANRERARQEQEEAEREFEEMQKRSAEQQEIVPDLEDLTIHNDKPAKMDFRDLDRE